MTYDILWKTYEYIGEDDLFHLISNVSITDFKLGFKICPIFLRKKLIEYFRNLLPYELEFKMYYHGFELTDEGFINLLCCVKQENIVPVLSEELEYLIKKPN